MIVQKPADLDPAMKSALKNHIMRKRQQLRQELEQDAIEKRLKREQEAKRKQDAMTLDQLKEQLNHLERTLDNLKNEKHSLFAQLKQNMRVLNEDDTRRKQKEGELNAARQQQIQQNEQNRQQIQQQLQTTSNGPLQQSSLVNQENHVPLVNREKQHDMINHHQQQAPPPPQQQQQQPPPPQQQQHLYQPQQQQANNHQERDTPPANSQIQSLHNPSPHSNHLQQRSNPMYNSAAFSHLINAHNFTRQSPYLTHLPPQQQSQQQQQQPPPHQQQQQQQQQSNQNRHSNPYGQIGSYSPFGAHPPSLISGHGIPTSIPNIPQNNPMIRPSPPPPPMTNSAPMNPGLSKMSLSLPNSGAPTPLDFNTANLMNPANHQMHQNAAMAAALGLPYQSFLTNAEGRPLAQTTTQQIIDLHHAAQNAAAANMLERNQAIAAATGGNNMNNSVNSGINNNSNNPNQLPPMKRPISATNLANDTLSPNKKMHTQQPPNQQNQPHPSHQIPGSLTNPYLPYPGIPPQRSNHMFNPAALLHLMNAHNFTRQSPYLGHLPQQQQQQQSNQNRLSNPYGPLGSYSPLGSHPPSLISGLGIPTSMPNMPQNNSMIRPSPPPPMTNQTPMNPGAPKMSLNMPNSGVPNSLEFNPNLMNPQAHQLQPQGLHSNNVGAVAAALGIPYQTFLNSNNPIGPPITSHQSLDHQAAINAAINRNFSRNR